MLKRYYGETPKKNVTGIVSRYLDIPAIVGPKQKGETMKKAASRTSRWNKNALFEAMGHMVSEKTSMGAIQSIMVAADGTMFGGADPRRSTSAAMGF
jgi:gamma-glutamyltranspeptidase